MTSLHAAVRGHAEARPGAPALVCGDRTVSYGELDHAADAWAGALADHAVGPGALVPVLLPRGVDLVVAVLAILKSGAAYALLDPAWPERRIQEVIGELGASTVVARPGEAAVPPGVRLLPMGAAAARPAAGFRPAEVPGSAPACVFFTSGTTGRPKGVLVPHQAVARLFRAGTFARFATDTVIPLAAALPWDAFCLELWGALVPGGTSLIVEEPYLSAQALREGVRRHGVDTVWLTSSLFNMIVDEDPDAFGGLRQVMTGGERLSVPHVRAFLTRHRDIALINGYGPVENTVFGTTHRITREDCERPGGIPVGRPVPGTRVHVVDGEICLSGEGLALRYLGDPTLTADRFPDVVVEGRAVRVYRTGDLGVVDEDGLLHYRGRADRQVKVRGHRVEPAEVERQIEELLPAVRHCRVVPRRDAHGHVDGLLAFCVPRTPGDLLGGSAGVLRTALVRYQQPDAVISVAAFPLTSTGKLDERALLALAEAGPGTQPSAVSATTGRRAGADGSAAQPAGPRDPLAETVVRVFADVLGTDRVPDDVPFTELGGGSLAAGRVCARLSAELGRSVPLSRMYAHPTAAALAGWLSATPVAPPGRGPHGGPGGSQRPDEVPLTPMQRVYTARHLLRPDDRTAHCLMTWRVDGELDLDALEAAVGDVHRRHEALGCAYVLDPEPVCRAVAVPPPVLEMLPAAPDAETAAEALRECLAEPLEITDGDVWRTVLVPLDAADSHVLGCVVHHVAFDGWSESVLAADLAEAYNARLRTGKAPARPDAPGLVEAHRLRTERLASADLDGQRSRLVEELTGVPELPWPDSPARAEPGPPGRYELTLDARTTARIDREAARRRVTRFSLLLSRYGRLLNELTGAADFAVGVPVAQRHDSRLEDAVGCHIDMACVRLRGDALAGDLGTSVSVTARVVARAFGCQDVAFEEVVRLVNPPRTGRAALFQTLFVLQDNALPTMALSGPRTRFLRPRYLELPLEVQTEVWPLADGGMRLVVNYRPDAVSHDMARSLVKGYADLLRTLPGGASS
ncbi:AMP-binding protein [Streptomyces paradoxus]|uniref:AMP-binding protein n=1 Tax=Streptomyces paradoxus TaxID=66375 RepID=UPI0036FA7806